jgi:hypothetical protein
LVFTLAILCGCRALALLLAFASTIVLCGSTTWQVTSLCGVLQCSVELG